MGKTILRTDVTKLKKQQLLTYVNQTVTVLELHDPVALHINVMLDRLKAVKPELELLEVSYGDAFEETPQLVALDASINNVLRAIMSQSKAIGRIRNVAYNAECTLVLPFVKRYVKASIPENLLSTVNVCERMLSELEDNDALKVAIETVGLKVYIDEVERLLAEVVTISESKVTTMTTRGKSKTEELKLRVAKLVSSLMKAIEVASEEYAELDYNPLIEGLNVLNTTYRTVLKAKETRAKSANEAKNETTDASSVKTVATAV